MSLFNSLGSILQLILALLIVVFLANVSLKYLNKKISGSNRMIKIVERVNVSKSSALGITEICGSYYLMSLTDTENKILRALDEDEVEKHLADSKTDFKEPSDLFVRLRKRD